MLKFKLSNKSTVQTKIIPNTDHYFELEMWRLYLVEPQPTKLVGYILGSNEGNFLSKEIAPLIGGDLVEFLNDKYFDKEINKEWPAINVEERIKYHQEQIKLLKEEKSLRWNEHGTGVE